jgi:hypothetical protein
MQQTVLPWAPVKCQEHCRYEFTELHRHGYRSHMHAQRMGQPAIYAQRHDRLLLPAVAQRWGRVCGVAEEYTHALQMLAVGLISQGVLQALRALDDRHVKHCHAHCMECAVQLPRDGRAVNVEDGRMAL